MFRRLAQGVFQALSTGPSARQTALLDACRACEQQAQTSVPQQVISCLGFSGPSQLQIARSKYTYTFKRAASVPGLVFWKPRTNGLRHKISIDYKALGVYTGPPIEELSFRKFNTGGRNKHGHITVRGRGGGIKKIVRMVDAAQTPPGKASTAGVVERVEADPNRTGFIALVRYDSENGGPPVYKYHLAPHGLRQGDTITTGASAAITTGNRLKLRDIPLGTPIHNVELIPGKGGAIARAAGTSLSIKFKEGEHAVVGMPSGEVRRIPLDCMATIGSVSNPLNKLTIMGKAGVNRNRGRRPKVRGVAMNAVDHPMGGKTSGGRVSCTPWGVYCKGQRTRYRNKPSNAFIITRKGGQPIDKFVQAKKWRARAEQERKVKSGGSLPTSFAGPDAKLLGPAAPAWGATASVAQRKSIFASV